MVFLANVRKDWTPKEGFPYCHGKDNLKRSGRAKVRAVHDVVRNNYLTIILFQPPRMECTTCKQRFVPTIDGIVPDRSYTERLHDYIKTESFLQPHTKIAETSGLSIQTVQNIMTGGKEMI